jgi:hypothetical protein
MNILEISFSEKGFMVRDFHCADKLHQLLEIYACLVRVLDREMNKMPRRDHVLGWNVRVRSQMHTH